MTKYQRSEKQRWEIRSNNQLGGLYKIENTAQFLGV